MIQKALTVFLTEIFYPQLEDFQPCSDYRAEVPYLNGDLCLCVCLTAREEPDFPHSLTSLWWHRCWFIRHISYPIISYFLSTDVNSLNNILILDISSQSTLLFPQLDHQNVSSQSSVVSSEGGRDSVVTDLSSLSSNLLQEDLWVSSPDCTLSALKKMTGTKIITFARQG